jgi:hypothetical protein
MRKREIEKNEEIKKKGIIVKTLTMDFHLLQTW